MVVLIKLQDVVNLPHKHLDASDLSSMAVAVHRNFIELEHQLAVLQHAIKRISGGTLTNVSDTITTTSSLTAPRIFYGLNNRNIVNLPSGTNLDTLTVSDRYDCINFINRPPGISGWAYLEHIQHGYSSLWSIQVIYGFHNLNEVYMRSSQDSGGGVRVWSAWSRVWHEGNNTSMAAVTAHTNRIDNPHTVTAAQVGAWHSGNDGIGSGLDADLVRGAAPFAVSHRQGGHAASWNVGGTTNHTPAGARVQVGATAAVTLAPGSTLVTVTFPVEFASTPLVIATVWHSSGTYNGIVRVESVSATQVGLRLSNISAVGSGTFGANWVALGPV